MISDQWVEATEADRQYIFWEVAGWLMMFFVLAVLVQFIPIPEKYRKQ